MIYSASSKILNVLKCSNSVKNTRWIQDFLHAVSAEDVRSSLDTHTDTDGALSPYYLSVFLYVF